MIEVSLMSDLDKKAKTQQNYAPQTIAVRAGIETDTQHGSIIPPLYLSTNYSFAGLGEPREFDYSRSGNPTRQILGDTLAALEEGVGGIITSTGMSSVFLPLQLLKAGERVLVPHDCYGGSFRLFKSLSERGILDVDFVDQTDEKALLAALEKEPRIVWLETPSNPLLRLVDIKKVSELAKAKDALVVVDNTFLSPVLQKPLLLGADIVVHSMTKYLNGHSDVVAGGVVAKDQKVFDDLAFWANCTGITGSPFDSFQVLRGLRTLDVRMQRHCENAEKVASYLKSHAQVDKVYFPGFEDHPGHEIAAEQQLGFGAMISFELKGGVEEVKKFLSGLNIFSLAESLGGVESLVCHPSTMTHLAVSLEDQKTAGIEQNLLRLSIGLEGYQDIQADLESGFSQLS